MDSKPTGHLSHYYTFNATDLFFDIDDDSIADRARLGADQN
jgi:hypothetical protein